MKYSNLTERIIGSAVEVHKELGPGLFESVYESAMAIEFEVARLPFERQVRIPATYKSRLLGYYRIDFIVEKLVVVEIKAVERFDPIFESQVITYLRVTGLSVGLLINFNTRLVTEGVKRFVL